MKVFQWYLLIFALVFLGQNNSAFAFRHYNFGRWHTDAITGENTSNNPNPGQTISFIINPTGMPDITEDGIVNQTDI